MEGIYENPLITRYASREMMALWSTENRTRWWRRLWVILAEEEQRLGLRISDEALQQMRAAVDTLNLDVAARYEREKRHDVMAHVHAYGDQCPAARAVIHWGATSCYVTDNADLILIREAMRMVRRRLLACLAGLGRFAHQQKGVACLAWTHLQPAQPTTVGKRATLWAYDLVLDLEELDHRLGQLKARSAKGTTGTQASFLQLFDGDHEKVRQLERRVAERMGFAAPYAVTGQTYPRKVDAQTLDLLSGIAQSLHKIATDLRLLASRKEMEEPFEKEQIGSSAMAYKRNPMRSERICSLARWTMSLQSSPAMTAAVQWFERTLDDSANRRLVLPQGFLAIDAAMILLQNVVDGLVVYRRTVERNLMEELPFMATEAILMAGVAAGGDRQDLHERIRVHSQAAAERVKMEAKPNDLLERLEGDPVFSSLPIRELADPNGFTGRAEKQVEEFLAEVLEPLVRTGEGEPAPEAQVRV
ncbi:MAG: adenylosuccinate lyase [Pirellulaceae bacterium]